MGTITHKAGRIAVSKATDIILKNLDKDREKEILKLVDFMEKLMALADEGATEIGRASCRERV